MGPTAVTKKALEEGLKSAKHWMHRQRKTKDYLSPLEPLHLLGQRLWRPKIPKAWLTDSFLRESHSPIRYEPDAAVPRTIFLFWTGDNEMSPTRRRRLTEFEAVNRSFDVTLITSEDAHTLEVANHPLHPALDSLSFTHRSDYLRAYCMFHHGGGYSDIKRPLHNWEDAHTRFSRSDKWAAGYPESRRFNVPQPPPFGKGLWRFSGSLIGQAAWIARPHTPIFGELLLEMERRLDQHADALSACPPDPLGSHPAYPLRWSELLGEAWYPLQLKYRDHLLRDRGLDLDLRNYR